MCVRACVCVRAACVRACARARVRVCARVCAPVWVSGGGGQARVESF